MLLEKGISLLNYSGRLGYILPNKFLNSQVGANLRSILSVGRWVREIVHFSSFQIFYGVTTYTCLLFLGHEDQKVIVKVSRYIGQAAKTSAMNVLPDEAPEFWKSYEMPEARLTKAPWELNGSSTELFDKLKKWPKLGSIEQIFQGTGTRADKVFLLEDRGVEGDLIRVYSHETNKEYLIEQNFLKKAVRGRDISRYKVSDKFWWLIVPYKIENGKGTLVPFKDLEDHAPRTVNYLRECKPRLDKREKGRFKGEKWYCFGRPQNLGRFELSKKIVLPDVVNRGKCCLDTAGLWLLDTAYAIEPKSSTNVNILYILGILNSPILTHFLRETGTALRGGYFRMKTAYLNPFPIPTINFSEPAQVLFHNHIISLVEHMLSLHQQLASSNTSTEKTLLQRQIDTTDHQIDALVYELYGLTDEEIKLVEGR